MSIPKMCKRCGKHPAVVPDRDMPWNQRKSICQKCHGSELMGDLANIMRLRNEQGKGG